MARVTVATTTPDPAYPGEHNVGSLVFFPSHLIPAEHTTQIHTVKERVTQDFTV